jgi:hypothetical protein
MNVILFGISLYLLSQKRRIVMDDSKQELSLTRRSLFRTLRLSIGYQKIGALRLGVDHVYSGFAVAGSSAAESFPVPALRVVIANESILLDRGSYRRMEELGRRVSERLKKPLEIADVLR